MEARLQHGEWPSRIAELLLFLVGAAGTDVREANSSAWGEQFRVPPSAPGAVGTRERRDADGMRAVSRKLEAVLCAPPPFCHRGLLGVDFGLTAPRLRTVAESGMDRCCSH